MTGNTLCVVVCDSFRAEVEAVAASLQRATPFATFPARCGRPPVSWDEIVQATSHLDVSHVSLIGGCCLSKIGTPPSGSREYSTTVLDNCFRLFLSGYGLERYLAAGAYLVTPGWLKEWRSRMAELGFDREGARAFFGESCRSILLVDTGVSQDASAQLEEFCRFVDRPFGTVPAGIDLLTLQIERRIDQWKKKRKGRLVSEYAMAVDLLSSMTEMVDEEKVAGLILEFYHLLFGATDLAYVVMVDGEPERVIRMQGDGGSAADEDLLAQAAALDDDHQVLHDCNGFLLAISHAGEVIGVVRAAQVPLPHYSDDYLSLALSTAGVCGLALKNARSFQRITTMTRQLGVQKRILEGINTIFGEALSPKSDEKLGRTCLSVVEELTGSRFGFVAEIGEDGLLHDTAISDPGWELCTMYDRGGHRLLGNFRVHGLYGSVVQDGQSVLANAPAEHPASVGTPEGHPPLTAFLGVPLKDDGQVTGMIAVANRPGGYGADELEAVEALAPAMVAAFRHKRAQEALQQANELLEERVAERTRELADREARRLEAEHSLHLETLERLRISEALREKERLLIQQSRLAALGEMINNIAHQWRQPLNTVGLVVQGLQLMYEYGELDAQSLEAKVNRVMALIRHMSQTIEDFRHFFKPDKEKVVFRVGDVVARTISLVEENFRSLGIGVEVESSDDACVEGYPNEYAQVLLNILINARDAFSDRCRGIEQQQVRIVISREQRESVVTIADNAGGIPDEILPKIFDPYFTTKGPDRGTGVGLYMAKTIIEKNMNGSLLVRNVDGGAEFRIRV